MQKPKIKPSPVVATGAKPTGSFYTVAKDSHLLYRAFQIDLVKGEVVAVKCLSRAPDLLASAVGNAQAALWTVARSQLAEDLGYE